ncbi:MAG: redoxin domain-containing protein [Dehalococcoidia bacterium]
MKKSKELTARAAWRRRAKALRRAGMAIAVTFLLAIVGWYFLAGTTEHGQPVQMTEVAPNLTLDTINGDKLVLSQHRDEHNVLLFFNEGIGCGGCWDQIVDLEADWIRLQGLDVELVSIMVDSLPELKAEAEDRGITGIVASDPDKSASEKYQALEASMHPGAKPGHTFVLVNKYGRIIWRWDWAGHGNPMYMEVDEVFDNVSRELERAGNKGL